MAYSAEVSRANPGCILFLIDQSASMLDRLEGDTKAGEVAAVLNRTLQDLITRCSSEEGVRDYFHVGVIGYGGTGPRNALRGTLGDTIFSPLSQLNDHPSRIEERTRKVSDGAGGLVEVQTRFPVWFDAEGEGGTPMCAALVLAAQSLLDWADAHPSAFPPVLIHLSDGEPTDGDPEPLSHDIRQISTDDGQVTFMNIHISGVSSREIAFPDSDQTLPDQYARLLFRMSTILPPAMTSRAREHGFEVHDESRAFMFNAKAEKIVQFFDIGTRPSNLR